MQIRKVPLASILLSLNQLPVETVKVNNDPPVIFYSAKPASLVVFDGEPVLVPAGKTHAHLCGEHQLAGLQRRGHLVPAEQRTLVLRCADRRSLCAGGEASRLVHGLEEGGRLRGGRALHPGQGAPAKEPGAEIFVSQKPAEIIVTAGAPSLRAVTGTGLQRVVNTSNILFLQPATNSYFVLLSGRWFSAHALAGPWAFATDKLPPDFSMIDPAGPDACRAGRGSRHDRRTGGSTQGADPEHRRASSAARRSSRVAYSGAPQFVAVTGTTMLLRGQYQHLRAAGEEQLLRVRGRRLVRRRKLPSGPWVLADSVPEVIYTIPAASPVYPVTYVRVYAVAPTVDHLRLHRRLHTGLRQLRGAGVRYRLLLSAGDHPRAGADLLSLSIHLRRGGLVQPEQWRLGARRHGVRTLRSGVRRHLLQPEQRRLGPRRGGLRAQRRRGGVVGLQPKYRQLRAGQRLVEQRQRHRARQLLQRAHRGVRIDDPERQSLQPLGVEHLLRRRTRQSTRKAAPTPMAGRAASTPPAAPRVRATRTTPPAAAAVRSRPRAETCMPGTTATSTSTPTAAGPNTMTAAGIRCSRRPITPTGPRRRERARHRAGQPLPAASAPSERGNYQQLEQDRLGRQSGGARGGMNELRQQQGAATGPEPALSVFS